MKRLWLPAVVDTVDEGMAVRRSERRQIAQRLRAWMDSKNVTMILPVDEMESLRYELSFAESLADEIDPDT